MAGPTPSPNSKEQRTQASQWITLANQAPDTDPPELMWQHSHAARQLWELWWTTPMAVMWGHFDAPALERLLHLLEIEWESDGPAGAAVLSEIRQISDRFGLSPSARRKLYWRIEGIDAPSRDANDLAPTSSGRLPAAGGDTDPRKLRAV